MNLIPRNVDGLQDLLFDQLEDAVTHPDLDFQQRLKATNLLVGNIHKMARIALEHKRLQRHAPEIAKQKEPIFQLGTTTPDHQP